MEECRKSGQEMERSVRLNMEKCAAFVARMIEKYGREVLKEMEREQAQQQNN